MIPPHHIRIATDETDQLQTSSRLNGRWSSSQITGLVLAPIVMICCGGSDSYLIANFPATLAGAMMQDGPFRRIRHPRYVGLLIGRFAFAAMLGSVIGWIQCVGVTFLFTRRMFREERHLRATFPGQYDAYMQRTGRVLPKWS